MTGQDRTGLQLGSIREGKGRPKESNHHRTQGDDESRPTDH